MWYISGVSQSWFAGDWGVDPSDQICATQNMVHVT